MAASIAKHDICRQIRNLYQRAAMVAIHKRHIAYGPKQETFPQDKTVDPDVLEAVNSGNAKFRNHSGSMLHTMVELPDKLQQAADVILEKYPASTLLDKAFSLNEALLRRQGPLEPKEMRQKYNNMLQDVRHNEKKFSALDNADLPEEEANKLIRELDHTVKVRLRKTTHNWKSLKLNSHNSVIYLVARLARNYAVMKTIFEEIKKRDPAFIPGSIFDGNTGLGTSIWAANSVWEKKVFEYFCVGPSPDMNNLARLLLQNGSDTAGMCIPGVFFRQFQPSVKTNKFRMSVCAYALFEQKNRQERLELIQQQWKCTDTYMVLVEPGTNAGYHLLLEARDYILQRQDRGPDWVGHVFAPCPHDLGCPKLQFKNYPCTFDTYYKQLAVGQGKSDFKKTEKFTYLVMKKSPRPPGVTWPRVTQPTVKGSRHAHCYLCCPDATMNHFVVSKGKHASDVYALAVRSKYGDLLPVVWDSGQDRDIAPDTDHSSETVEVIGQSDTNSSCHQKTPPNMNITESADSAELSESHIAQVPLTENQPVIHKDGHDSVEAHNQLQRQRSVPEN